MDTEVRRTVDVSAVIDNCRFQLFHVRLVVLCGAVLFLDGFDLQAISYAAPGIATMMGLTRSMLGPIFSAGVLGVALGSFMFGSLADRLGRKRIFICCAIMFGLSSLITTLATSFSFLVVARFATGLGLGGATPIAITITADYCPKRHRSSSIIIMYICFALGGSAAGLVNGALRLRGWRNVFYIGGVTPLLLVPLLAWLLPEWVGFLIKQGRRGDLGRVLVRLDRENDAAHMDFVAADTPTTAFQPAALFTPGRRVPTVLLWSLFFTSLIAVYAYINWIPTLLSEFRLSSEQIVGIVSAGQFGGIAGGLLIAWRLKRSPSFGIIAIGYLLSSFAFLSFFLGANKYISLLIVNALLGMCLLGTQYGLNAMAAQMYPPTIRGTGVGWAIGIGRLGGILGPSLAGVLLGAGFLPARLFAFGAIPTALAAILAGILSIKVIAHSDWRG